MTRFKIKSGENPYFSGVSTAYFWVYIFDSEIDMYKYYERYQNQQGCEVRPFDFEAICMPYERFFVNSDGSYGCRHDNIGVLLFHKDGLRPEIIAHEMGHAAMWHERIIEGNTNARFGKDNGPIEERYLYTLYHFIKSFYRKKK